MTPSSSLIESKSILLMYFVSSARNSELDSGVGNANAEVETIRIASAAMTFLILDIVLIVLIDEVK